MAKLSTSDVSHIALLSNLTLTPDEIETYKNQLSEVVTYIEDLNSVDISGVEPTSQTTGLENVLRKDEINPLECLPQENGFYFKVPLILTNKDN